MRTLIVALKLAAVALLIATAWQAYGGRWHAGYIATTLVVVIVLALLDRLDERG